MSRCDRYTRTAVVLHWVVAALVLAQFAWGWFMQTIPKQPPGWRADAFNLHKSVGLLILALMLVRLGWRLSQRPPPLPPQERRARPEVAPAPAARVDGGLEQKSADEAGRLLEVTREFRIDLRVASGEAREFGLRLPQVVAIDDVLIAAQRTEQIVGGQHLEPQAAQAEVCDYARVQQAHDVGEARGTKAW